MFTGHFNHFHALNFGLLSCDYRLLKISNVNKRATEADEMPHLGLLIISMACDIPKCGQCNDLGSEAEFVNRHEP